MWFDVLLGDDKSKWRADLLDDPRVTEYWDADREIGEWFPMQEDYESLIFGPLAWDIFFLYGPEARWESVPLPVISSGNTIIARRGRLADSIAPLLDAN